MTRLMVGWALPGKRFRQFFRLARWAVPTLMLLLLPTSLPAAVIERDWQTPGDGLLTFDTVNQREWLDVPESLLSIYGAFELVVDETAPGGDFEGFRAAKQVDVLALAESAGIDTGTLEASINGPATAKLITLFGVTLFSGGGSRSSFGLIDNFNELPTNASNQVVVAIDELPPFNHAGLSFLTLGTVGERPFGFTGVMLYRQVPEPTGIVLALFSLLALCTARRFRV